MFTLSVKKAEKSEHPSRKRERAVWSHRTLTLAARILSAKKGDYKFSRQMI